MSTPQPTSQPTSSTRSPSGPSDLADLVRRAADQDQLAWAEIVERFTPLLWSVGRAHRLDQATTVDVVQMTWLRLVENLERIREPQRLAGWLVTTARHECLTVLRRTKREAPSWEEDLPDRPDPGADELDAALLSGERDRALWSAFAALSERCQRLLRVLVAADRPSYAEVAEALGLPVGSIGPTRMRCLDRLRAFVAGSDLFQTPRSTS